MNEMIKHGLVPNIEHSVTLKTLLETVRTKRSETDCQETESGGDSKKCNRHGSDTSRQLKHSPTVLMADIVAIQ